MQKWIALVATTLSVGILVSACQQPAPKSSPSPTAAETTPKPTETVAVPPAPTEAPKADFSAIAGEYKPVFAEKTKAELEKAQISEFIYGMVINSDGTFNGVLKMTGPNGSTEILGAGTITADGKKLTLTTTQLSVDGKETPVPPDAKPATLEIAEDGSLKVIEANDPLSPEKWVKE